MEMKDAPDNGRFRMWLCLGCGYPYSFSTYRIPVPERTGTLTVTTYTMLTNNANNGHQTGYIESAEQSRTAEQNKISKLTVKLQIISTEHDCRM